MRIMTIMISGNFMQIFKVFLTNIYSTKFTISYKDIMDKKYLKLFFKNIDLLFLMRNLINNYDLNKNDDKTQFKINFFLYPKIYILKCFICIILCEILCILCK